MEKSKTLFTIRVTRWNFIASFLLIAICAFQPHADPMRTWSLTTWFWLTMPVFYPWYLVGAFFGLKYIVLVICWLFDFVFYRCVKGY